jgi:hypothetical protein
VNLPGFFGRLWVGWDREAHKAGVKRFAGFAVSQSNNSAAVTLFVF